MENTNLNTPTEQLPTDDKITCECGKTISSKTKSSHVKSKFHLAHTQSTAEALPAVVDNVEQPKVDIEAPVTAPVEAKSNTSVSKGPMVLKLKEEFNVLNEKMDTILSILTEVLSELFSDEDEDATDADGQNKNK